MNTFLLHRADLILIGIFLALYDFTYISLKSSRFFSNTDTSLSSSKSISYAEISLTPLNSFCWYSFLLHRTRRTVASGRCRTRISPVSVRSVSNMKTCFVSSRSFSNEISLFYLQDLFHDTFISLLCVLERDVPNLLRDIYNIFCQFVNYSCFNRIAYYKHIFCIVEISFRLIHTETSSSYTKIYMHSLTQRFLSNTISVLSNTDLSLSLSLPPPLHRTLIQPAYHGCLRPAYTSHSTIPLTNVYLWIATNIHVTLSSHVLGSVRRREDDLRETWNEV